MCVGVGGRGVGHKLVKNISLVFFHILDHLEQFSSFFFHRYIFLTNLIILTDERKSFKISHFLGLFFKGIFHGFVLSFIAPALPLPGVRCFNFDCH